MSGEASYELPDEGFPPGAKVYSCSFDGCNYQTIRPGHLRRHERIHTKEKPYCCKYCTYQASRSDHLRRHEKMHERAFAKKAQIMRRVVRNSPIPQTNVVEVIQPLPAFSIAEGDVKHGIQTPFPNSYPYILP